MTDLVTTAEVADLLSVASADNARRILARAGILPVARQPGRDGQNLYSRAEVDRWAASRPGRGARTDLTR